MTSRIPPLLAVVGWLLTVGAVVLLVVARYDAQRTAEHFGRRLRSEAAVSDLRGGLEQVVTATLEPAHMSLWLRQETR